MSGHKKKIDACLLRVADGQYVLVKWEQLITSKDKTKLGVGSTAGYKPSNNKREKAVRGTIVVMGTVQQCQQQMKLLNAKTKKRKLQENESDSEDFGQDVCNNNESPDSDDTESSDSDDNPLEIDEAADNESHQQNPVLSAEEKISDEKQKKQMKQQKDIPSSSVNGNYNEIDICGGATSVLSSDKRSSPRSEAEPVPPPPRKQKLISLARLEELEAENARLKNLIEKYQREWMPRPTDPAVIRYFVRMGEIFSSNGEEAEGRGEKLANACRVLRIEEHDLKKWHKPNGTKTARTIVRAFYPKTDRLKITGDNLNSDFRQAIHDIINVYHGIEGLTEGKINESINNVFRSARSQQKDKDQNQTPTHSINGIQNQSFPQSTNGASNSTSSRSANGVSNPTSSQSTNDVSNPTSSHSKNDIENGSKKKKFCNRDKENVYRSKS